MRTVLEKKRTQYETVKAALLAGMPLTQKMVLRLYGGNKAWRLGGIVWLIENDKNEPIKISRSYHGTNRLATYWIDDFQSNDSDSKQLGLPL